MKSKTRLLTPCLVLPAACLAMATFAQTPYSLNVVGYINIGLSRGYNLICDQLYDYDANRNPTNHANPALGYLPDGALLYQFNTNAQAYSDPALFVPNVGWYPLSGNTNDPALSLTPGDGFIIWSPVDTNITVVGNVIQGNLTNAIPAGWSLKNALEPLSGGLQSTLGFPVQPNDQIVTLTAAGLTRYTFDTRWQPAEPLISVAQSFFVFRDPAYATKNNWWKTYFIVQARAQPGTGTDPLATQSSFDQSTRLHLKLQNGHVQLRIDNPTSARYDLQFSPDRLNWQTIAANQTTRTVWQESTRNQTRGFYRIVPANP
jgi:hypothetical protein